MKSNSACVTWFLFVIAPVLPQTATGQGISGFMIPGWKINRSDTSNFPVVNPPTSVTLTGGTTHELRSMFFEAKQSISSFEASFDYTFRGDLSSSMGAALVIQNLSESRVARTRGSIVGYTDNFVPFGSRSMAIILQASQSGSRSFSGTFTNGRIGGGAKSTSPVNFFSGNPIEISVSYDGFLLELMAEDSVTGDMYVSDTVLIDIPSQVGGSEAWVGFTASTGNNSGTSQTFANFEFGPLRTGDDCNQDGMIDVLDANCTDARDLSDFLSSQNLIPGDADGDGKVQLSDFVILSQNYRMPAEYTGGDFDKSGFVDLQDFVVLVNNFGSSTAVAVPEPSTTLQLLIAILILPLRRLVEPTHDPQA